MRSKLHVAWKPEKWHIWFAWRPVKVNGDKEGEYTWAWWERLERRFRNGIGYAGRDFIIVEYRFIQRTYDDTRG